MAAAMDATRRPVRRRPFVALAAVVGLVLASIAPLAAPVGAQAVTPVITTLAPFVGSTLGGQSMTIYGSGFTGMTGVQFGQHGVATDVIVVSDTQINCTIPPAPTATTGGPVNVFVWGPGVVSATSPATVFWYQPPPPPTITSISPATGPTTGGTELTITGTNLDDPWQVRVDGIVATDLTSISPTQLTAVTPAHAAGEVDVTVQTIGGTSAPGSFTYVTPSPPQISHVIPGALSAAGGTAVTIEGSGFSNATAVRFGLWGAPVPFTVHGDERIEVVAPAGPGGTIAGIRVQTPLGTSDPWLARYVAPPRIEAMVPTSGPTAGDTQVQLAGVGFSGATGVSFGGVPALAVWNLGVGHDGLARLVAFTPPLPAGPVDVVVHGVSGDSTPDAASTFLVTDAPPPTITWVTPNVSAPAGGTVITVHGTGLSGVTDVSFGLEPAATVQVVSDTELVVTTPPHRPGTLVNLWVTAPSGAMSVAWPSSWVFFSP